MKQNERFIKFLEENSEKKEVKFDPDREIQEWLKFLDDLYAKFVSCLESYEKNASIYWGFKDVTIFEESLGSYSAKRAVLEMGGMKYLFDPIGTMLVGSKGRVDVRGPSKVGMLALVRGKGPSVTVKIKVLNEKDSSGGEPIDNSDPVLEDRDEWRWKIVKRSGARLEYIDLDELSITNFLIDLA